MYSNDKYKTDPSGKVVVNENNFHELVARLHELSYMQPLGPKSAPLVSRMLSDLLLATTSNAELTARTTQLRETRDLLAAENVPLTTENRRLVRENNQLHVEMIRQAEDFERREHGWLQAMKKNEGDAQDASFMSGQNQRLVDQYETEIEGLKTRLARSLSRNLVAERPDQSHVGGARGDPIQQAYGVEGRHTNHREKYPQVLEWSGSPQKISLSKTLCPSPKRRAPDPGGGVAVASLLNDGKKSSETVANTQRVVQNLTEGLKAANSNIDRLTVALAQATKTGHSST